MYEVLSSWHEGPGKSEISYELSITVLPVMMIIYDLHDTTGVYTSESTDGDQSLFIVNYIIQDTYFYYTGWKYLSLVMLLGHSSFVLKVAVVTPETEIFEQLPKPFVESVSVGPIPDMGVARAPQEVWWFQHNTWAHKAVWTEVFLVPIS